MPQSFENLIEKYGVPFLVIPNQPRLLSFNDWGWGVFSEHAVAEINVTTARHQRIPLEGGAFLLVKAQLEIPLNEFGDLKTGLEQRGIRIVEYKRWTDDLVRLTLATDVTPISREDLFRAIAERKVISVSAWRSMGDAYVDFHITTPDMLEDEGGYHFFFPSARRLGDKELPASGSRNSWESTDDFFASYKDYFTREYLAEVDKDTVEANPHIPSPDLSARVRHCSICSQLTDREGGFQKIGREEQDTYLPASAAGLQIVKELVPDCNGLRQLRQCPECQTFYLYREEYEFLIGGSEDEQQLTRLTPEDAVDYLKRPLG